MLWSLLITSTAISTSSNASPSGLDALALVALVISGITIVISRSYLYFLKRVKNSVKHNKITAMGRNKNQLVHYNIRKFRVDSAHYLPALHA